MHLPSLLLGALWMFLLHSAVTNWRWAGGKRSAATPLRQAGQQRAGEARALQRGAAAAWVWAIICFVLSMLVLLFILASLGACGLDRLLGLRSPTPTPTIAPPPPF